jgi:hypothetical protein
MDVWVLVVVPMVGNAGNSRLPIITVAIVNVIWSIEPFRRRYALSENYFINRLLACNCLFLWASVALYIPFY